MQLVDCALVAEINQRASNYPWTASQFEESFKSHSAMVLVYDENVVGFAVFNTVIDEACLLNIAIHPQYQRLGLACHLLEHGLKKEIDRGAEQCYLEVRESNQSAIKLYEKLGFAKTGLRKNYYPLKQGREHAVIMAKVLINPPGDGK